VTGNLPTARAAVLFTDDLPAFCEAMIDIFARDTRPRMRVAAHLRSTVGGRTRRGRGCLR
jgi:hypothetical protein